MIFSYLNPDNIFDRYSDAKSYTEQLTRPFHEFERIARNRPHEGLDPQYPKTTDGTTASIIRKTPKRVVQQLPTGSIISEDDDDWLPVVAEFIYLNKILPYANDEYDLIQKCWTLIEKSLTFGAAPVYTPFLSHDGNFSTDLTSPYWGDIFLQRGKKSGYACNYVFMRSWWQKEDIEALIDREKKLTKNAKGRNETYDSSWDTAALKEILDAAVEKDNSGRTPHEKERQSVVEGIELVTGFQKGVGASFYTFNPVKNKVVRTKKNKDPRGKIPIDWMYGDTDGSNPLGRGIVELIGGLQNLIDSDMQMYQYNRALMLAPPIIKRGNFNKSKVVFAPNKIIDLGSDQNASLETLKIDTTAVVNYPQLYQLQQSQLLNLVSSPNSSIPSDVGAVTQGKTPAALNQQKSTISVDDNFVRKMFEACFENWSETAVNLYFAERSGIEELQLNDDAAKKLRKLADEGKFDLTQLSDDNKIRIDYDTDTPALHFRVDASTSKMKDDSDQLAALQGILASIDQSPMFQQLVPQEKIMGLYNALVANSGVEEPEELSIDIAQFKKQQEQQMQAQAAQQAQAQAAQPGAQVQAQPMPQPGQPQDQGQPQPPQQLQQLQQPQAGEPDISQLSPVDQQLIGHLESLGLPDEVIVQAIQMAEKGVPADQILQAIGVGNG